MDELETLRKIAAYLRDHREVLNNAINATEMNLSHVRNAGRDVIARLGELLNEHKAATVNEGHFNFLSYIQDQIRWSLQTFGPHPRTRGLIQHVEKELKEIEAEPDDLEEWVDVMIIALDGAWRAGYTAKEIVDQLVKKQEKNRSRKWPDWRTKSQDEAIEHIRDGEAPPPPTLNRKGNPVEKVSIRDYFDKWGPDAVVCLDAVGDAYEEASYVVEEGVHSWAWACTRLRLPTLLAADILEERTDKGVIDPQYLDIDGLQDQLDAWLSEQSPSILWVVDDTRIVIFYE